jgi:PKD repeat protein
MTLFHRLCVLFAVVNLTATLTWPFRAHGDDLFIPQSESKTTRLTAQPLKVPARFAGQIPKPPPSLPALTLTADPDSSFEGQNVRFTATWSQRVSGPSYRFEWGDGQHRDSDQPSADHSYAARGRYTVRVLATAIVNKRVVLIRSNDLSISVSQAPPREDLPVPTLSANPPRSRTGEAITFTAALDPRVGPAQYHFYFDDGTDESSERSQIAHIYERPGVYRPYVKALLGHGDETVTSNAIEVTIQPREVIPILTVTLLTEQPIAGQYVTVAVRLDPPYEGVRYEFDWGDGSPLESGGADGRASHNYAAAKLYTVRVTAQTRDRDTRPTIGSLTIPVQKAPWSPPPGATAGLLVLLIVAGAAVGWHLRQRARASARSADSVRVTGHPDPGSHRISRMEQVSSSVSLTLKPGMDAGADRITFL